MKFEPITPPVLKTRRLTLRPLRDSDAGLISLYAGDIRIAQHLAIVPYPYPPGAAEAFIERTLRGDSEDVTWAIELDNELIGVISITPTDGARGNVGYWLAPQLWGAGYTPEALEAVVGFARSMGLVGLDAHVHQDNPGSARVLIKEGFDYCGDIDTHSVARNGNVRSWKYRLEFEHESA